MKHNTLKTTLLLAPFIFSFAFALDVYIPAVPEMIKVMHTDQAMVQLTLSVFMVTIGIGQLFVGPASDQYGRKYIALGSVILFTIGSIICATAHDIMTLIIARVIEALGSCGMLVTAFAIVRDRFTGDESAKVYSFLNCGLALSPLFAPIIGSYLITWFGWRSTFIFLSFLGLVIIVINLTLIKESLAKDKRLKLRSDIFLRYWRIVCNKQFFAYVTCGASGITIFFTFFSMSPYIIIELLHYPTKYFGYFFFTVGLTFFVGSLISGRLAGAIGIYKTCLLGSCIMLLAGISMFAWFHLIGFSAASFIVPSMIAGIGGSLMMGAGAGGAMEPFGEAAGSAAALFGSIQFLSAAIIGTYVMHQKIMSTLPLASTMTIFSVLSAVGLLVYKKRSTSQS